MSLHLIHNLRSLTHEAHAWRCPLLQFGWSPQCALIRSSECVAILGCVRTFLRIKRAADAPVNDSSWLQQLFGLGGAAVVEPEAIQSSYELCMMTQLTPQQLIGTHVANGDFEVCVTRIPSGVVLSALCVCD